MSRGQVAWLVTWDWADPCAAVEDRLAAILRPRTSRNAVEEILRCLYAIHAYTPTEQAGWAKHPAKNPYKPGWHGKYICQCGHHPYLIAQYVRELIIEIDSKSELETISYVIPAEYEINPITREKTLIREKQQESFTRTITGTLSDREIGRSMPKNSATI